MLTLYVFKSKLCATFVGEMFHSLLLPIQLKYCRINKKRENRLYVHLLMLFSLELFDMQVEKAAVFFDKIFNLIFCN